MAGVAISKCLSCYRGALVGALVGDCLGAPYEGRIPKLSNILQDFHHLEEEVQRKEFQYTDDTAMLRSIVFSLLDCRKLDTTDLAKRFVSNYFDEPWRGYGGNVVTVFKLLDKSKCADPFEPASLQFNGSGSFGNGGAMRIAPAALFGYNLSDEELGDLVINVTRITHTNANAVNGAILQCFAVQHALKLNDAGSTGVDSERFLDGLQTVMEKFEKTVVTTCDTASDTACDRPCEMDCDTPNMTDEEKAEEQQKRTGSDNPVEDKSRPYRLKLLTIRKLLNSVNTAEPTTDDIVQELGNDISALGSVPTAIYCFLRSLTPIPDIPEQYNEFERTILYAISLGGDTDTIATMAGAIAGVYHGIDKIPEKWSSKCEGLRDAFDMADQLYKITGHNNDEAAV